jgi:tetratricopeptide (TPR) repeat protein
LAADLPSAEKAVGDAEELGTSAGEVRMLRGFIAMFAGRNSDAVVHLEQAVRLMPESVTARSLLVIALEGTTDFSAALRTFDEALKLPVRTPEDKLFLGFATDSFRPAEGLKVMDEALKERSFGIGHILRADVSGSLAEQYRTVELAEAAVADAEMSARFLDRSPNVLAQIVYTNLYAADAYQRAGRPDKRDEHLAAALRQADRLAHFPANFEALFARCEVAITRDGLDGRVDMLDEIRVARRTDPGAAVAYLEAMNLLTLGRDADAAQVADAFPDDRLNGFVRFLLALGRVDGRDDARQVLARISRPNVHPVYRLEAAQMLLAVGTPVEVAALSREIRAKEDDLLHTTSGTAGVILARLRFVEGGMTEAELLAVSSPDNRDRTRQFSAVAWRRLGEGDREGAKSAFRQVYDLMGHDGPWFVARAVLIRMKDPNWPQAILKKNQ